MSTRRWDDFKRKGRHRHRPQTSGSPLDKVVSACEVIAPVLMGEDFHPEDCPEWSGALGEILSTLSPDMLSALTGVIGCARFDRAWSALAKQKKCGPYGGLDFKRIQSEWIAANSPEAVDTFILNRTTPQ